MGNVIVTASSAALVHACGWSFRPDVQAPPQPASQEATRGTIFGLLAEQKVNGGPPVPISEKLATLSEEEGRKLVAMWGHASTWIEANMRSEWCAERAFVYDPTKDEAREIPRATHRDYSSAGPGETVAGTADIVAIDGDAVLVFDWKTSSDGAPGVDAREQLEWLALMACRAWGFDAARIVTPKVTEFGVEAIEGEPLDMFGLAAVAERIAADVARIPSAEPVPGEHCKGRYCKALPVCPSTEVLMAQIVPADSLARKEWRFTTQIESPDHLERILSMLPIASEFVDRVKKATVAYVADGPKRTSDGREIKQAYRDMPRLNQGMLTALAKQLGATEEQLALCVRTNREPNGVRVSAKKTRAV